MTKEEKEQLLFIDLCSRIPYKTICTSRRFDKNILVGMDDDGATFSHVDRLGQTVYELLDIIEFDVKPYLRPMSSMTLEEHRDWMKYCKADYDCEFQPEPTFNFESCILSINWLNQHHFDYNNLIEEGLAIEVTEEHNPYKGIKL